MHRHYISTRLRLSIYKKKPSIKSKRNILAPPILSLVLVLLLYTP